ncbi:hypothetical protein [Psychromicrobium lacuslunae]|uniref:hypothetical protein n=1 Tax=Psychromicrobium lacuslunae TaxID=1618207 RepID=UPI000A89E051|nr:hypothetical protein [Psychromicrobium lacuslunae]
MPTSLLPFASGDAGVALLTGSGKAGKAGEKQHHGLPDAAYPEQKLTSLGA